MPSGQVLSGLVFFLAVPTCHSEGLPLSVTCIVTISFVMVSVISSRQRDRVFDYLCLGGLEQPGWFLIISSAAS